jgi:hypothetical protein
MTANSTTRPARLLLVGASALALAAPLSANEVLFTTGNASPETGERTAQERGLTQIALTGGGTVSIVDAAEYRIAADGSIDLYEGSLTVAGTGEREVVVRMPEGLEGRVAGTGSAGNFSVRANGEASGHALDGTVRIGRAGDMESFAAGELWRARSGRGPRRVVANAPVAGPAAATRTPARQGSVVAIGGDAGPVAAALNGIPVGFVDQLAGAGASSDILAAARRIEAVVGNPALDTFPSGDFALLVAAAARLENAYGGEPFAEARADIILTYLRFLSEGGAGSKFVEAYSSFTLAYLDFLRAGGLPSGFAAASPADIEAWLAYVQRTGALANLATRDRVLAEAYLEFLRGGGSRGQFTASFTELTTAYFAFVRGGGDPSEFTGASAAVLAETIAFLSQSGLAGQLGAADRALIEAFLASGGLAFAAQYEAALADYFAFIASGRRPSEYAALDQATLRAYLETLADTGLLETVLGERAGFFADYLAFLRAGGSVDGFAGLPVNIFAGYAADLAAFYAFLEAGGVPSSYTLLDAVTLRDYIAAIEAAGASGLFLGDLAGFWRDYAAFLAGGGTLDTFAGLPVPPDFPAFAAALNAYATFLAGGGLPSDYDAADIADLAAFLEAIVSAGRLGELLGTNADLLEDYFAFLAGGGSIDGFAGLPLYADYVAALNAYFAFLAGGGLPGDYTVLDAATIEAYLAALAAAQDGLAGFAGLDAFFADYFAFIAGGGDPDRFARLPLYLDYIAALNAYFDFLAGGGLPSDYTLLDAATIEAYLAALAALEGGLAGLGALNSFFVDYFVFIAGGGDPNLFAGLPGNGNGGGTGGNPDVPTMLAGYSGGFDPASARIDFILGGALNGGTFVGSERGFGASSYTLDPDGGLSSYTRQPGGQVRNRGAAVQTDVFGNADAVIGRWTDGTIAIPNSFTFNANQGLHYMLARPVGPDFVPSLTGRVDYYLIGATRPTIADGSLSPGEFEAGLALLFGSDMFLAMEGTITMPDGADPYVFTFATEGGLADPTQSASLFSANGEGAFSGSVPGSDNRGNCDASPDLCFFNFRANFAGGQDTLGMTYEARSGGTATTIIGAAILERGPERTFGGEGGDPGGGTGGGDYTGGFSAEAANSVTAYAFTRTQAGFTIPVQALTPRFGGSNFGVTPNQHLVDPDGGLSRIQGSNGGTVIDRENAGNVDIAGDADLLIGRWTDGTIVGGLDGPNGKNTLSANQGFHYFLARGLENPVAVPDGLVSYTLAHATQATLGSGRTEPGTFNANLAIRFGAAPKIGIDGTIVFPGTLGFTYTFATDGGAAAPSKDIFFSEPSSSARGGMFQFSSDTGSTDNGLDGNLFARGSLGKADGSDVAIAYTVDLVPRSGFTGESIAGAAIFRSDTVPGGGSGGSGGAATVDGIVPTGGLDSPFSFAGPGSTGEVASAATMTVTDGVLRAARRGSIRVEYTPSANSKIEATGDQGVIGWQRINRVTTVYSGGTGQVFQSNPFAEQYWHTVWGAPLVNLPTVGLVNYEFIGGSTAHQLNARPGDGTFSGRFSVDFASLRAGIEASVSLDGPDAAIYDFASDGGVAAPSMRLLDDGFGTRRFSEILATTERGAGAVSAGTQVAGFLAGDGASHAGMTYAIRTSPGNSIVGTAAFRAQGAGVTTASGSAAVASIAPGGAPMGGIDMSRWGGTGSATPQGTGTGTGKGTDTGALSLLPPGAGNLAERRSGPTAAREAERLLGGLVTFPAATASLEPS